MKKAEQWRYRIVVDKGFAVKRYPKKNLEKARERQAEYRERDRGEVCTIERQLITPWEVVDDD